MIITEPQEPEQARSAYARNAAKRLSIKAAKQLAQASFKQKLPTRKTFLSYSTKQYLKLKTRCMTLILSDRSLYAHGSKAG